MLKKLRHGDLDFDWAPTISLLYYEGPRRQGILCFSHSSQAINADIYINNTWQSTWAILLIKQQIYLLFVYVMRWSPSGDLVIYSLPLTKSWLIGMDWIGLDLSKLRKNYQQLYYIISISNTKIFLPPYYSHHKFTCYRQPSCRYVGCNLVNFSWSNNTIYLLVCALVRSQNRHHEGTCFSKDWTMSFIFYQLLYTQ